MIRTKAQFFAALLLILPLTALAAVLSPALAAIAVNLSVGVPPPPLLVTAQPRIPGPGYLWMPGYWAWNGTAWYWVPGTWVLPPRVGLLWTPPWWGLVNGVYVWHAGYWGPHVGFYGGINYGFGYSGHGYDGGFWNHGRFFYNRAVNNIRTAHFANTYNRAVASDRTVNRISFNGGRGGVNARPTHAEQAAAHEGHVEPTLFQTHHVNTARYSKNLLAASSDGRPRELHPNLPGRHVNEARQAPQRRGEQKGERGRRE